MTERSDLSLQTLSTSLIHRILQHLDDFTLFCTVPNICTNFREIVENNDRYKVEHQLDISAFHETSSVSSLVYHYSFIDKETT